MSFSLYTVLGKYQVLITHLGASWMVGGWMNGKMVCSYFPVAYEEAPELFQLSYSKSMFLLLHLQLLSYISCICINLKHIFSFRSETHDWSWKFVLCTFI